jgi:beta-xylosidase
MPSNPFFKQLLSYVFLFALAVSPRLSFAQQTRAQNPIIFADVPDLSMIRVGDTYYMSSTTMHMSPGVPIMKSTDLSNWELIGYAYDQLVDNSAMNLSEGESAYGRGSWASCLRYHEGRFYLSTFSATSGKTHIYITDDIEKGKWKEVNFEPSYHDHSIYFDEDGKIYLIWGAGEISIVELEKDLSGIVPGTERVLIENASKPAGENIMLNAEGSQIFKVGEYFYLFNIVWPRKDMRTVLVHRSKSLHGPYEGKVVLKDRGIAQGGLIDTPDGNWYAYLFRDYGAVGRIPYLVPVTWENDWPVLGENGKVPDYLDLPVNTGLISGIVASDDFSREERDFTFLPLVWQWNHNPVEENWSLTERPGFLRLKSDRFDNNFVETRNTLTQRTFGPKSQAVTRVDLQGLEDGDVVGLGLLQKEYGFIGIKAEDQKKALVMSIGNEDNEQVMEELSWNEGNVYLKAICDFENQKDSAFFQYSKDGKEWKDFGAELKMTYTLPHFMGYRFGLFYYSTKSTRGYADFDFFEISIPEN